MFKTLLMFALSGTSTAVLLPELIDRPACMISAALDVTDRFGQSGAFCPQTGRAATSFMHTAEEIARRIH